MQINKAIRLVMKTKGVTLESMGRSLRKEVMIKESPAEGKTRKVGTGEWTSLSGNDVSSRLNSPNMTFDKALEMLSVLGYEIIIQEKRPGPRRNDQIVIDQKV